MEETQRTLDEFWNKHASHLRLCLQLRQFELDFRELQVSERLTAKKVTLKTSRLLLFTMCCIDVFSCCALHRHQQIVLNDDIQTVSGFDSDGDSVAAIDAVLQQTFDCRTRCQVTGFSLSIGPTRESFETYRLLLLLIRLIWIAPMRFTVTRPIWWPITPTVPSFWIRSDPRASNSKEWAKHFVSFLSSVWNHWNVLATCTIELKRFFWFDSIFPKILLDLISSVFSNQSRPTVGVLRESICWVHSSWRNVRRLTLPLNRWLISNNFWHPRLNSVILKSSVIYLRISSLPKRNL